jgi:antitoxin VapB
MMSVVSGPSVWNERRPPWAVVRIVGLCYGICQLSWSLVMSARKVRLFRNGRNQAVRIPREFELPGDEAILRREGDRLVLEPVPPRSLLAVLAALRPLHEDMPPIADPLPEPVEL